MSTGTSPPLANYGADGLPKLSWRVALLPYLDQNDLYKEFRQDEPWDSPHNKALIDRMPAVFQTPDSPAPDGKPGSVDLRARGPCSREFGASGSRISPTAPRTPFSSPRPAIRFPGPSRPSSPSGKEAPAGPGPQRTARLVLGLADGSVRSLPKSAERLLRRLITRAGGEVIVWPPPEGFATTAGVGDDGDAHAHSYHSAALPPDATGCDPRSDATPAAAPDIAIHSGPVVSPGARAAAPEG